MNKLYFTPTTRDADLKKIEENTIEFKDEENCQKMMKWLLDLGYKRASGTNNQTGKLIHIKT